MAMCGAVFSGLLGKVKYSFGIWQNMNVRACFSCGKKHMFGGFNLKNYARHQHHLRAPKHDSRGFERIPDLPPKICIKMQVSGENHKLNGELSSLPRLIAR